MSLFSGVGPLSSGPKFPRRAGVCPWCPYKQHITLDRQALYIELRIYKHLYFIWADIDMEVPLAGVGFQFLYLRHHN